jgi:hypothetical protein
MKNATWKEMTCLHAKACLGMSWSQTKMVWTKEVVVEQMCHA